MEPERNRSGSPVMLLCRIKIPNFSDPETLQQHNRVVEIS